MQDAREKFTEIVTERPEGERPSISGFDDFRNQEGGDLTSQPSPDDWFARLTFP